MVLHGSVLPLPLLAQEKALDEWRPLQLLVEENLDLGIAAVANLAHAWWLRGDRLRIGHFRTLRPLVTPAARAAVLPLLLPKQGVVALKELDKAVERVTHGMWVDFHWSAENPNIDAAVRMLPSTSLCARLSRLPPPRSHCQ